MRIISLYSKCNKNEIKCFILQNIYTAKLPYQTVVCILVLTVREPTSHTLSCWDHILPILHSYHADWWWLPSCWKNDTLRYFPPSVSLYSFPVPLFLAQISAMGSNILTTCFLSSPYLGGFHCSLQKSQKGNLCFLIKKK